MIFNWLRLLWVATGLLIISEGSAVSTTAAALLIKMEKELEIFKPIKGYESLYEVSNLGRIKSLPKLRIGKRNSEELFLKTWKCTGDYISVGLRLKGVKKTHSVHVLVAKHFVDNPDNLPEVNHKDFDRSNNVESNLEWGTRLYNIQYSAKAGRITGWTGEESPRAKHTNESVLKIRELYASGMYTQDHLAEKFGVPRHNISKIVLRQRWAHI